MTIYISGKITGDPNYKEKFAAAEQEIKDGVEVKANIINPAKLPADKKTWLEYMQRDIKLLMDCDAIFMMKGWRHSKGARLERYIAKALGLVIIYEKY